MNILCPAVRTGRSADITVHLIALVQQVNGTQAQNQIPLGQQPLADVEVPNQLVGIHRGIGISAAAML